MADRNLNLFNPKGSLVYFTSLSISGPSLNGFECLANLAKIIECWANEVYGITNLFSDVQVHERRDEQLSSNSVLIDIKQVVSQASIVGQFTFAAGFYDGFETTTIRFHISETQRDLSISSHMFSRNKTLSLFEIPRDSERLCQLLVEDSTLDLSFRGERVTADCTFLNRFNVKDSLVAKNKSEGQKLPIVIFDTGSISDSDLKSHGSRFFGLAHIFSAERDTDSEQPSGKVFIRWRDSNIPDYSLNDGLSLASLYRRLVQHQKAKDSFTSRWFAKYLILLNLVLEEERTKGIQTSEATELLRLELEESKNQVVHRQSDQEMQDFIDSFESARSAYKLAQSRYVVAISEIRSRLKAAFSFEPEELVLNLSRESLGDARSELETLSIVSNGAIIFTPHCVRTWGDALKRGYSEPAVMESELIKLSKFAMDYSSKQTVVGGSLVEYAKKHHGLELVLGDSNLPDKNFSFENKSFNQEAHIRADSGQTFNQLGRVHFALDQENSRLIVNIIGGKQYRNDK